MPEHALHQCEKYHFSDRVALMKHQEYSAQMQHIIGITEDFLSGLTEPGNAFSLPYYKLQA